MAKQALFPLILSLLLSLLLFSSGTPGNSIAQKTWCVARPSLSDKMLQTNLDFACSAVNCSILSKGCPCFIPELLSSQASVAMNLYYDFHERNHWNCDFNGTGLLSVSDPSFGGCVYP